MDFLRLVEFFPLCFCPRIIFDQKSKYGSDLKDFCSFDSEFKIVLRIRRNKKWLVKIYYMKAIDYDVKGSFCALFFW